MKERNRFYSDLNPGLESPSTTTHTGYTHIHALAHSVYEQPNAYWPACSSPFQFKADQWS